MTWQEWSAATVYVLRQAAVRPPPVLATLLLALLRLAILSVLLDVAEARGITVAI